MCRRSVAALVASDRTVTICVDACPYDALRDGADFELAHASRQEPTIDLMALAMIDRETEMTYIRRERDWLDRARADGRIVDPGRLLPVLPAAILAEIGAGSGPAGGNGHGNGTGNGHAGGGAGAGPGHAHTK